MIHFTIHGNFPSLNTTLSKAMSNFNLYSKLKKDLDEKIRLQIKAQKVPKIEAPLAIVMRWFVRNKRVDPDNTYSVAKYILDAMQDRYTYIKIRGKRERYVTSKGIWSGDGFKEFPGGLLHTIDVDKEKPRVEITLIPNGDMYEIMMKGLSQLE